MIISTDPNRELEQLTGAAADAANAAARKPVWFAPFTIAIDTREQAPWSFLGINADASANVGTNGAGGQRRQVVVSTVRTTLRTGDYSIVGHESEICIERKSHEDLYQTLIEGRDRFEREFERMRTYTFAAVVVEASWSRILQPPAGRRIHPKSISRSIMSLQLRFPSVQWVMAPDRRFAEIYSYQLLAKFHAHRERERKAVVLAERKAAKKAVAV